MFDRVALVHYHEIGLKGRNRSPFERRLEANLRSAVDGLTDRPPYRVASRLLVPITSREHAEALIAAVSATPGVTTVSPALVTAREPDQIFRAAELAIADFQRAPERRTGSREPKPPRTFAVKARRSSTDFPVPSNEMNIAVGDHVAHHHGYVGGPGQARRDHLRGGRAGRRIRVRAPRCQVRAGCPPGPRARSWRCFSAGIDSPVAAWRIIKRGAVVVAVHFSGRPQTDERSVDHVLELGEVLERTRGLARVDVVTLRRHPEARSRWSRRRTCAFCSTAA